MSLEQLRDSAGMVSPMDTEAAVKSRVPRFNSPKKTEYLVLRSVSFTHDEALRMLHVDHEVYAGWLKDDLFSDWLKSGNLRELQKTVGADVLRNKFLRAVFLQLSIDGELLAQRMFAPSAMSEMDRKEAFEASKRYSAPNIAAMMKVLGDDKDGNGNETNKTPNVEFNIVINGEQVVSTESKKALAAELLQKFTTKADVVDGEYSVNS